MKRVVFSGLRTAIIPDVDVVCVCKKKPKGLEFVVDTRKEASLYSGHVQARVLEHLVLFGAERPGLADEAVDRFPTTCFRVRSGENDFETSVLGTR